MIRNGILPQDRKRVVIVDDSKTMQAVLDQVFSLRMGMDVVGLADDVESAAPLIRSLRPDLVTIDLCMPYINGRKLLDMLADLPDVRKVVVSSQVSQNLGIASKLCEAGADACVDKRDLSRNPAAFCAQMRAILAKPKPRRPRAAAAAPPCTTLEAGLPPSRVLGYPIPVDEQARLIALLRSGLANDDLDARLDLITQHMGKTTDFPTCLLTIMGREHQWIKSAHGFARGSTPRAVAFCNYTLCADDSFIVTNAATDVRFASNPLVVGEPGIRTYVGCPIVSSAGTRLGALCLIDTVPRQVNPDIVVALRSMSGIATEMIEARCPELAAAA
jgi:DNA-binding NarL/FixJ family response regulator